MDLKEESILGEAIGRHWYYRAKAAALHRLVRTLQPHEILDVGAGSGFFSRHLLAHSSARSALCVDPYYESERDEVHSGKPVRYRRICPDTEADLVLMMDVLEHVEDDRGLLDEYVAKAPPGAYFLVSVPAFQFLWSGHDVFLGHFRRYTLKQLVRLLRDAGLEIEQHAYFYGLVFPLAATLRLFRRLSGRASNEPQSDLKPHGLLTNSALSMLCRLELPVFTLNRLAGLSAFCLARKGWRSSG